MKQLSFVFFLYCAFQHGFLFAQNTTTWFVPGAKWGYGYESLTGPGEQILENVGTADIGGQICAKVHVTGYHSGWPSGPFDEGYRYFFARNDSVFLWGGNAFKLLYDFNRAPGDTFSLTGSIYDHGLVLHTGDTVWNNIPLRFQDLILSNDPTSPGGDTTRIYERLGGTHLIYWDLESHLIENQYFLDCYRDNEYPQQDCHLDYDPTYIGFPSTATWSETDGSWCGYRGYQYKMEGDSVIWGVGKGKKVYFRNTYSGSYPCPNEHVEILHEPYQLIGLLDQSIQYKKVSFTRLADVPNAFSYCTMGGLLPLNEYTLLYDFDLEIGDTVHWKPEPNIVLAIDSILMDNGTWRRSFVFDENLAHYWIEGLGTNLGLFGAFANTQITDVFCGLKCFRQNNQLLYSTVDAFLCDSVTVATKEPKLLNNNLRLSPNPTSGNINLDIPDNEVPAILRVFDSQGRELGRMEVTEAQSQQDLSSWRGNAILLLQIQGASGQMAGRVLRIE